jgi:hypothetical protein
MRRSRFLLVLLLALAVPGSVSGLAGDVVSSSDSPTFVGIRNLKNWGRSSTPTSFYQTIEQCFAKGIVPSPNIAEPRKGDGATVMTKWQADNRITWDDGSLRCARFTFKYQSQLAPSGTDKLKFYSRVGAWNNTPWATAAMVISKQDYRMEVVISGTTYTCGVNNMISEGAYYQFDAGPTAVGLVMHGVFRNGMARGSTDEGALQCRIYVVAFENGDFKVWARADSCRPSNSTCAAATVTSAALKNYSLGAPTIWNYGSFTFYGGTFFVAADTDGQPYYSGADVRMVVDAFPAPVLAKSYTTNLWDAKVTPFFKVTAGAIADMVTQPKSITYFPVSLGDYTGQFYNSGGGSSWIGWYPYSSAVALWGGDWNSLRQDTVDALTEGAQQWHFRDSTNGNLINFNGNATYNGTTQNTTIGWGQIPTIVFSGGSPFGASQVSDPTHIPSFSQFQLEYSGEEWWLDQYQDQVVGEVGATGPGNSCYTRNPLINSQWYGTIGVGGGAKPYRGYAWYERDAGTAAWLTPSGHPLYQYMQDLLAQQYGAENDYLTSNTNCGDFSPDWAAIGIAPDLYGPNEFLTAPWMNDYWGIVASMNVLRGLESMSNLMIANHLVKFVIGRSARGCAYAAAAYNMNISSSDGDSAPWATAWSQVSVGIAGNPSASSTIIGGSLTNYFGSGCPSSGLPPPTNGFQTFLNGNYPNILLDAAILAQQASITGAAGVVTRYQREKTSAGCCTDADVARLPQWAIATPQ